MLTSRALDLSNPGSVSSKVSVPWWLCLTQTHLYRASVSAGQAKHASERDGSATGIVQTKIRSKATRVFISQGEPWLQRKKGQELLWAVSCHAPSLFFSTQPTARPWGLMAKAAPATWGYHVCGSVAVSMHMQDRLGPPPFLPKLGLCLGLWHLQLQPKHRLPDQLASSPQWSEPFSVGKLFHKGRGEMLLGTAVPLEKWFSRNLNIKLPFAFSLTFWALLSQPIIYLVQNSTMFQIAVVLLCCP